MLVLQNLTLSAFILLALSACGAGSSANKNRLLSEIVYKDHGVELCVTAHVEAYDWEVIEDVVELYCSKTSKSHVSLVEEGIWDTSDLEQFIYLESLDISGNYYSEFNPRPLTALRQLQMEMSFIGSIDLSKNVALEALDVSSTPLTQLDLSYNLKMKEIRATADAINSQVYQDLVMLDIDYLLEIAGLPYEWGAEIRTLSTEIIISRPLNLTINSSAPIELLRVLSAAVIEYVDTDLTEP